MSNKPLVLSAPDPRSLDLIFTDVQKASLHDRYQILEIEPEAIPALSPDTLSEVRYVIGQPPIDDQTLSSLSSLRCIFNVESNLIDNMPYDSLFERGIHVVTTGAVFAEPVAELGLALALALARNVVEAQCQFREGNEVWGLESNKQARLLTGSTIGLVGFGDLGRALARLLAGFRARIVVYDPWLPNSLLHDHQVEPATLDRVLSSSDTIFVVASVTSENQHFLNAQRLSLMRQGAALILLSRADVVDFDALYEAVYNGAIVAASDVFPEEPLDTKHPIRELDGFIGSAHRAGALDVAFKKMGDMVLEDMALLDKGLPPMCGKRAERETVSKMRSRPVDLN